MELVKGSTLTANFTDRADVAVFTIGAKLRDGGHVTDGQIASALNAAKSVLQLLGAEVEASSTTFFYSDEEFEDGEALLARTTVELYKETEEEEEDGDGLDLGEVDEAA